MKLLERLLPGRSEREARALLGLVAFVSLVLLVAAVWLPLERTRARLSASLPEARASTERLQRQADEVKRLRAMPPAAGRQSALDTLASTPPAGARVATVDPKRVRLTSADTAFTALLEWIVAAEASHGLRVETAKVDALGATGRVKADILMSRP